MNRNRDGQGSSGSSNYRWHADITELDIPVIGSNGFPPVHPQLAAIVDEASECVMGLYLSFTGSDRTLALALRHAVLPKHDLVEYELHCEWQTYGVPEYLVVDRSLASSQPIGQLATRLAITVQTQSGPSQSSKLERFFQSVNRELLTFCPGYTGSTANAYTAGTIAVLSALELEKLLIRYVVDRYNQHLYPRAPHQTRFQRWQSGLLFDPPCLQAQDLDL